MLSRVALTVILVLLTQAVSNTVKAETRIVPSISVSERYDTNVFFGFAPPGVDSRDYVTNVSPQLTMLHNGRLLIGTLNAGMTGEIYAINPALNYVGFNGSMSIKADGLIQQLSRRATLNLTDTTIYTPQPPAFFTPRPGEDPALIINEQSFAARGIQAFRADMLMNTATVNSSYLITPQVTLTATYVNTYMQFGSAFARPVGGGVFNFVGHALNAGPALLVTPRDTVSLSYQYNTISFTGSPFEFQTNGAALTWSRKLSPFVSGSIGGGGTIVSPGNEIVYTSQASLQMNYQQTLATLIFSRGVAPSYFIAQSVLISYYVTLSVGQRLSQRLDALMSVNYGNSADPSNNLSFETFNINGSLNYAISQSWGATVSYSHFDFKNAFEGQQLSFDRNIIMVGVRAVWN